jgi:hypothetical protein
VIPRLAAVAVLLLVALMACPDPRRGGGSGRGGIVDDDDSGDDDDAGDDDDGVSSSGVDILLVLDNSSSMAEIHSQLQAAFPALLAGLVDAGVEFQLGVTTTDIESPGNGRQGNIRSLSAIGSNATCDPELLTPDSGNLATTFSNLVDVGTEGSGSEAGISAAAFALCKAQDDAFWTALSDRPDDDPVRVVCGLIPLSERSCNNGFLRQDTTPLIIVVSDEGDDSYRSGEHPPGEQLADCVTKNNDDPTFGECDCRLEWWLEFFSGVAPGTVFLNIGPTYQPGTTSFDCGDNTLSLPGPCNSFGSAVCSIDFYQQSACLTGGLFFPMATTPDGDPGSCELSDFESIAADIGAFLGG